MKITIENTTKVVELNGIPARVWEGATESGVKVVVFVSRISVPEGEDTAEFEKELKETKAPSVEAVGLPLRMIL